MSPILIIKENKVILLRVNDASSGRRESSARMVAAPFFVHHDNRSVEKVSGTASRRGASRRGRCRRDAARTLTRRRRGGAYVVLMSSVSVDGEIREKAFMRFFAPAETRGPSRFRLLHATVLTTLRKTGGGAAAARTREPSISRVAINEPRWLSLLRRHTVTTTATFERTQPS